MADRDHTQSKSSTTGKLEATVNEQAELPVEQSEQWEPEFDDPTQTEKEGRGKGQSGGSAQQSGPKTTVKNGR